MIIPSAITRVIIAALTLLIMPGAGIAEENGRGESESLNEPKTVDVPGLPIAVVEGTSIAPKPAQSRTRRKSSATGAVLSEKAQEYSIVPGQKIFIDVAVGFSNRIATPWKSPRFITSSKLSTERKGTALYLTPPDARPIGGWVTNEQSTEVVAVVLVPKKIPPQEILLTSDQKIIEPEGDAVRWERSQSYLETISRVMETMATQGIPVGYAIRQPSVTDSQWTCQMDELSISAPMQVLEGNALKVLVYSVTNQTDEIVEATEDNCLQPGVRAAAVWPPVVSPNGSSELYLIVNKPLYKASKRVRPAVN